MDETAVLDLFFEFESIQSAIGPNRPSDLSDHDRQYRKIAVLSCASYLEAAMLDQVGRYFLARGSATGEFVRKLAIDRKFHTWFDFDKPRPDRFFKLFGQETFAHYNHQMAIDRQFEQSAQAFMQLLTSRNLLIHRNLAEQSSDLTFAEVRDSFSQAKRFPGLALDILESCDRPHH